MHPRRGVVGADEQQVQQVVAGHRVAGPQVGGRGARHVATLDRHRLRQIGQGLQEDDGRHHLGDAGDRAQLLRVLLEQHLVGLGVVDDGGGGARRRHFLPILVELEARGRQLAGFASPGGGACPGNGPAAGGRTGPRRRAGAGPRRSLLFLGCRLNRRLLGGGRRRRRSCRRARAPKTGRAGARGRFCCVAAMNVATTAANALESARRIRRRSGMSPYGRTELRPLVTEVSVL